MAGGGLRRFARPAERPGRAVPRGGSDAAPDPVERARLARGTPVLDAHGLAPDELLGALATLESRPGRTLVVACEPAALEPGIGLSAPVAAAVDAAVRTIVDLVSGTRPPGGLGAGSAGQAI